MQPETLLFFALLLGAFALLVARTRWHRSVAVALAVSGALVASWSARAYQARQAAQRESRARIEPKVPLERPGHEYVSSDHCEACHPSQYASWHRSYHRTMTQKASPATVLGNFDHVTLRVDGEEFHLERRGDEYWVEMVDPDWKHDQAKARAGFPGYTLADPAKAPRIWKRIGMITGSHHFQAYWIPSMFGNTQFAFPFAWLIPEQRWVPRKDTFVRDPEEPSPIQNWNVNCIQCHATGANPGHDPKTKLTHTSVGELGIACEACHGPAGRHVEAHRSPLDRYVAYRRDGSDPTIFNPARQTARVSSEACGQCHGMRWRKNVDLWRQQGSSYRPGGDLESISPLIRPASFEEQPWIPEQLKQDEHFLSGAFWPDGKIRVTGREYNGLVESACHVKGNMTCLSCHSIHDSNPAGQVAAGMAGNRACTPCHEKIGSNLEAHTHHPASSTGSLCYNCHMPYATYGLLKAVRNHYIDSPSVKTSLTTGRPNGCNLCHLDKSLGWTDDHLVRWYGASRVPMHRDDREVSATVLMALRGNAAQRALMAANLGRPEARAASGAPWTAFHLCQLMDDPYAAVRLIAFRSLQTLPGFEAVGFDPVGAKADRDRGRAAALGIWRSQAAGRPPSGVLLRDDGTPDDARIRRFLDARDQRVMDLIE